jgi:hypothetical protein
MGTSDTEGLVPRCGRSGEVRKPAYARPITERLSSCPVATLPWLVRGRLLDGTSQKGSERASPEGCLIPPPLLMLQQSRRIALRCNSISAMVYCGNKCVSEKLIKSRFAWVFTRTCHILRRVLEQVSQLRQTHKPPNMIIAPLRLQQKQYLTY